MYDVVIIGAGVCGSACARELSKYQLQIAVLEKYEDVCCGTSKANSGIVHAGYDAKPGSLMAKLNVQGNRMMPKLAKQLDIPFAQNGSLVVCLKDDDTSILDKLYQQGIQNGVEKLEIIDKDRLQELEPNVSKDAIMALYAPTAGIICPFTLNLAMAENAASNGSDFHFNQEVKTVKKEQDYWVIKTTNNEYHSRWVINASGIYGDYIHNQVSDDNVTIIARKGEYYLLDKNIDGYVKQTIFQSPTKFGKGVLVAPSVHGNILVGPTASDIEDKENLSTTSLQLQNIKKTASRAINNLPLPVITTFSGLRAHQIGHEFIIQETVDHFIDCIGIESPGLTASPAIGEMIKDMIVKREQPVKKEKYNKTRKGIIHLEKLDEVTRNQYIKENPTYGNIVCRCEMISEGEIIDAMHSPLKATSLDGLKRRVRTMAGRCQGGFCMPKILKIVSREEGVSIACINKSYQGSNIVVEKLKECVDDGKL